MKIGCVVGCGCYVPNMNEVYLLYKQIVHEDPFVVGVYTTTDKLEAAKNTLQSLYSDNLGVLIYHTAIYIDCDSITGKPV